MGTIRPEAWSALNEIADHIYETAKSKGFHDQPVPMANLVANLHGEVSELWESYRWNALHKPCDKAENMRALGLPTLTSLEEEIADIIIRALDTARETGVDVARAVRVKDAYNQKRPHRNGGKAA